MNVIQKIFFASAALGVLSSQSLLQLSGVDAAVIMDSTVNCLETAPDICVGFFVLTTPYPSSECNNDDPTICWTKWNGGYRKTYDYVEGLEHGEDAMSMDNDHVELGPSVKVRFDEYRVNCEITVGTETCKMCAAVCGESYGDVTTVPNMISYDCSNLENGATSEGRCEATGNLFYPFVTSKRRGVMETNTNTEDSSAGVEVGVEVEQSFSASSASGVGTTRMISMVLTLGFGTLAGLM
mmetsp:Transcript_23784/g.50586  ORF Transcript_23784/g.50586 Transcript_23784/m.50586 type:complete len:239 (+) Transcript_23784:162-878(+)|eukprot:CAMPEP_0201116616 /NCGR_PEP_ID=MMETSP0850-20130426/827_1 /ASSEMBLY_ACC=CAM_ASM_000622 /TAXON_ID=183588 /ORGANISM="Pseudo-nitzschia fraudulenta, Strain WWA7" /LENGTH=238 /DNA_ID=CAMNT_0047380725 /DNA_START=151 /DNA_END=867 /DNA_ORIENTATION=-